MPAKHELQIECLPEYYAATCRLGRIIFLTAVQRDALPSTASSMPPTSPRAVRVCLRYAIFNASEVTV
jgi:hypothetical protein